MRVRQFILGVTENATGNLVFMGMVAAAVAAWSLMTPFVPKGWSWLAAIIIFLVVFCLLLALVILLRTYLRATRRTSPNDIKLEVRDWLFDLGYKVGEVREQGFTFILDCEAPGLRKFQIYQPSARPRLVGIQVWLDIEPEWRKILNDSPSVLSNMRVEMARLNVNHTGIFPPVERLRAFITFPWDVSITDMVLEQRISQALHAQWLLGELGAIELYKAGIRVPTAPQPNLPQPKEQSKPEQQT